MRTRDGLTSSRRVSGRGHVSTTMLTDLQKRTAQAIVNIFETGRARGDYARVTLLPGDPGHLTYGRSQTTLASGNLHLLIKAYCECPDAAFASRLGRYLGRLAARDVVLDKNEPLRALLHESGADPVMHDVQDQFFDRVYWTPAMNACTTEGICTPLGSTVVYDSRVHGGWSIVRARTEQHHGTVTALGEHTWIGHYVAERHDWLANHSVTLLHRTVYRMDTFAGLIHAGDWDLPLPLRVRGVDIDQDVLAEPPPVTASAADAGERTLLLRTPRMQGPDVTSVQTALVAAG
ncbi:MAG TPA: chitosanase, partial [Candidatus Krumholzibacteria bacterium]|nr:chitosanase [Candidatus Krumholzibacteria bacterium]